MIKERKAFIVGVKSTKLSKSEITFLKKYKPWGIILFSRNIISIKQAKKLTEKIRLVFKDRKYPILIDQEGGRVNRLNKIISFDNLTSKYFGLLFEKDKKKFDIFYKLFVDKTSYLLKSIGVNINTVPVLDLKIKGSSKIIGDRSFSKNKNIVSKIGNICIKSFHENSIGTVMKHIPGHGLAKVDSHLFTPRVTKSPKYLFKNDFYPFKKKNSFFAMTAHVVYTKIDRLNTATHSKKLMNIIRKKIGFRNILISDDLSMKSLKDNIKTNTIKTFSAGCNIALHCNANLKEMKIVGNNSPLLNKFIIKKTSLFYKILS
jgi:beta-N-acetylhexosaminidase